LLTAPDPKHTATSGRTPINFRWAGIKPVMTKACLNFPSRLGAENAPRRAVGESSRPPLCPSSLILSSALDLQVVIVPPCPATRPLSLREVPQPGLKPDSLPCFLAWGGRSKDILHFPPTKEVELPELAALHNLLYMWVEWRAGP